MAKYMGMSLTAPFESGEDAGLHDEVCAGKLTQTVGLDISWAECFILFL